MLFRDAGLIALASFAPLSLAFADVQWREVPEDSSRSDPGSWPL
jgi:hypothetical protein